MDSGDIENFPTRKRKHTMSSPGPNKDPSIDLGDSVSYTVTSKSFYRSTKKYLTPLERRDIRTIRGKQIASCDSTYTPNKRLSASSCKTSTPRRSTRLKQVSLIEIDAAEVSDEDMFDDDVDSSIGETMQDYELKMFESPAKSSSQADLSISPASVDCEFKMFESPAKSSSQADLSMSPASVDYEFKMFESPAKCSSQVDLPWSPASINYEFKMLESPAKCSSQADLPMFLASVDYDFTMFESPAKPSSQVSAMSNVSVMSISDIVSESSPHSDKSSKKLLPTFGEGSPASTRRSSPRLHNSSKSSPHSVSSRSSHQTSKRPRKANSVKQQMILDFGQKRVGAVQCEECGMTYSPAEPGDVTMHRKFHRRMLNVLKFPGWKKERVVQELPDGSRVVMVLPEDKYAAKKVDKIKQIVDEDLGLVVEGYSELRNTSTFLYINENKVVGCCVAQVITQAYRVLSVEEAAGTQDSTSPRGRLWCCSTRPECARVGISRIWVLASHRRKKIATQLLDCVRYNFIMGYPLSVSDMAFLDPTPAGMGFAAHYTSTPRFLVYKRIT